jgi:radical SAM protein with 4Fe4S-binding SPASM domain
MSDVETASDQPELGNDVLTNDERARILRDGSRLAADVLWTDDEVRRWRRYLEVAYGYDQCDLCDLWHRCGRGCPCTVIHLEEYLWAKRARKGWRVCPRCGLSWQASHGVASMGCPTGCNA